MPSVSDHYPELDEDTRLAASVFINLLRAADSVTSRVHMDLAEVGLTFSQFAVLEVLLSKGPLCTGDISRKVLRNSSGNMTVVVDNLEKASLVQRERGTRDRRTVNIRLTEPGRRLMEEFYPRHLEYIRRELSVLSTEELLQLRSFCRRLGLHLQPARADCESTESIEEKYR